jgi:hypothetical protein
MTQIAQVGGTHYSNKLGVCPHCQGEIQAWDLTANMPFLEASAIKYLIRHAAKDGFDGLKKAISYVEKRMAVDYPAEYAEWKEDVWARTVAAALETAGCAATNSRPIFGLQWNADANVARQVRHSPTAACNIEDYHVISECGLQWKEVKTKPTTPAARFECSECGAIAAADAHGIARHLCNSKP